MAYILRQFNTGLETTDYLNGIILGKAVSVKVQGLHGLTLKVTPVATLRTVTFDDAAGVGLTPTEIIAQIEDVHADTIGIAVFRNYRHTTPPSYQLAFYQDGDVIDKSGTANEILGFDTAANSTVGTGAIALADIVSASVNDAGNKFTVIHQ